MKLKRNRPLGINLINLTGKRFTRLIVIKRDLSKLPKTYWFCKCDCDKIKSVSRSKLLSGNTKSCGCLNRELSSKRMFKNNPIKNIIHPMLGRTRELSPNWRRRKLNAKTPEILRLRMTEEYSDWRRDIFTRDKFTCQKCGKTNCYLEAHHIKSFSHYPDLRFDRNNGITLCEDCHKKTDNYGKSKKNTS